MNVEPQAVRNARRTIREWELRNGHDSYVRCLDGGWRGYQAACWDCDYQGPEHLRGNEPMSTPKRCSYKQAAKTEAATHRQETKPGGRVPV